MHGTYSTTRLLDTRQQTDTLSAAIQSPNARERDSAMFGPHSTTDTITVSTAFPIIPENLLLNLGNDESGVSYGNTWDRDEAPDSPCTLLGDELDLDESCSPLSLNSSSGCFIAETPPRSPSTILGDNNDLGDVDSPTSSGISSGTCHAEDQPRSPSTILGDYTDIDIAETYPAKSSSKDIFAEQFSDKDPPYSPSTVLGTEVDLEAATYALLDPGLSSPNNYHDESEDNEMVTDALQDVPPQDKPARASRCYVQRPGFVCDVVPLTDEWPAFIIEAFIAEDWKFGLDEEGKTVLELISGRKDLEKWFTKMGKKLQIS